MKFEVRKQTQWSWFNKLISQETYGSDLKIVVAYSLTIKDKLRKVADVKELDSNTFYLTIKVVTDDFNSNYAANIDRVLYAAEAKCNHVIGFGADQIHFTQKDVVSHVQANSHEYFFIEVN